MGKTKYGKFTTIYILSDSSCECGVKHDMILFGGHLVCLCNEKDYTMRPSLDWAIVDKTKKTETPDDVFLYYFGEDDQAYQPSKLPKPVTFHMEHKLIGLCGKNDSNLNMVTRRD